MPMVLSYYDKHSPLLTFYAKLADLSRYSILSSVSLCSVKVSQLLMFKSIQIAEDGVIHKIFMKLQKNHVGFEVHVIWWFECITGPL